MSSGGIRFSEHIDELRRRLKVIFLSFLIILIVVVFFPADPIQQAQHLGQYTSLVFLSNTVIAAFLHRIVSDILPPGWALIAANGIGEPMEIYFVGSMIVSIAICMPIIAYETYKFVDPALKEEERRLIYPFVLSTSLLFMGGLIFGYVIISKFLVLALAPFFLASGTTFQIDAAAFYYVIFLVIGATGASFTSPVFVYALIRLRVLDAQLFSKNRVVIWFVVWVITGLFLTPDGGPLLDLVIFIPIVILIEAAVFLGRRSVRGREPTQDGRRCVYCGAKLAKWELFCPSCGRGVA